MSAGSVKYATTLPPRERNASISRRNSSMAAHPASSFLMRSTTPRGCPSAAMRSSHRRSLSSVGGPWDRRRRRKPTGVSNSARGPLTSIHTYSGGLPSRRARALRIRRQRFTRVSMISDIWKYGTPQHEKRRMINSETGMVTDHQTAQEDTSSVLVPDVREKLRRSGYTLTSQRRAVLEALSRAKGHPSAEDVYLIVKRENPRVAL